MMIGKNYVHVSAAKSNQRTHAKVFFWFHIIEGERCYLDQRGMHSLKLALDSFLECFSGVANMLSWHLIWLLALRFTLTNGFCTSVRHHNSL